VTGRRINSSKREDGTLVEAKSARGMPLEYEIMEEPIDEIPDVKSPVGLRNLDFGWFFQNPACNIQSQVSWTLVKGPPGGHATRGIADQTPVTLETKVLPGMTGTQPPSQPRTQQKKRE
jgi:hypothetical protein